MAADEQTTMEPSEKALGKRPATEPQSLNSAPPAPTQALGPATVADAAASRKAGPLKKVQKQATEKRVTRSSLGGQASREGSVLGSEGLQMPMYLPASTPIVLTTAAPSDLSHHPPLLLPNDVAPAPAVPSPSKTKEPDFRLLTPGDAFSRSRHAGSDDFDTSDAFYHRLHRYPEVLEKRSARLERERLIHERSKLINELEELRGRGWVYYGSQGGKGEEERRRKIREGEERLKRYDALLPNQPRKSNFLTGAVNEAPSRSNSPAAHALNGRPGGAQHRGARHYSPMSASADGGTTIKIKFGASSMSHSGARPGPSRGGGKGRLVQPLHTNRYTSSDESDYGDMRGGDNQRQRKRDRKAELARAAERVKLGLPPRSKLPGDPKRERRRRSSNTHRSRAGDSETEDEDEDDSEEDESTPRARRNITSSHHRPRRIRLPDSFFATSALRDQALAAANSRRSSSRLQYAFGQRLPEQVLYTQEFELFGGVAEDESDLFDGNSSRRLEEMVAERQGDSAAVWGGRVVPKSALTALQFGPIKKGSTVSANISSLPDVGQASSGTATIAQGGFATGTSSSPRVGSIILRTSRRSSVTSQGAFAAPRPAEHGGWARVDPDTDAMELN